MMRNHFFSNTQGGKSVFIQVPIFLFLSSLSYASFEDSLKKELISRYYGAEIELLTSIECIRGSLPVSDQPLLFLTEDGMGNARFTWKDSRYPFHSEGKVSFSAWMQGRSAQKRIKPGEALHPDYFVSKKIDVARGAGREYRGALFPIGEEISQMESTQTIMEGQFLVTSAVRKIPDVKRGEIVRIKLMSGDLTLSTQGVSQETGYVHNQIKVITQGKVKKEFSGLLKEGRMVEVQL